MADDDRRRDDGSPVAPPSRTAAEKRGPSWVTDDPFPPRPQAAEPTGSTKVAIDPSLQSELVARSGRPQPPSASGPSSTPPSPPTTSPPSSKSAPGPAAPGGPPPAGAPSRGPAESVERRPDGRPGRTLLGLHWWGWGLVALAALGLLFVVADLVNRGRFVVVCRDRRVGLQQGRRLPFPFGTEPLGGPEYKPFLAPGESDWERSFSSEDDAARSFLGLLLGQVRGALASPTGSDLKEARGQLQQALLLTRTQRAQRKEAEAMLAELSYREGRAGLARVESELRLALARFQEAQKLERGRFEDLDEWIARLEEILRSIAPSPFATATAPAPRPGPSSRPNPGPASRPAGRPGSPPAAPQAPAPAPAPDAGAPPGGGGILM